MSQESSDVSWASGGAKISGWYLLLDVRAGRKVRKAVCSARQSGESTTRYSTGLEKMYSGEFHTGRPPDYEILACSEHNKLLVPCWTE